MNARTTPEGTEQRRLDSILVERGLVESRAQGQWLIRQGRVLVAGQPCLRPGQRVAADSRIEVAEPLAYVSRGGPKLAHALDTFGITVSGRVALDVGAAAGGFTDCLLQRGAKRVYAVDVGRGQLHPRLRHEVRVVSLEQTDIRDLQALPGGGRPDLAVVDVSFISLRLVLLAVLRLLDPAGEIVALVKPQFEAGPGVVSRHGVVRDRADRRRALWEVLCFAHKLGLGLAGLCPVEPADSAGNVEFLAHLRPGEGQPLETAIDLALR